MGCSLQHAHFTAAETGIVTHAGQRASGARAQTWRGMAGLAARGKPDTQAQCRPACAWEAHSSCPGRLSPWSLFFFFFNEDCVFSEAALPSWVESLGQKEALVGVLALLLCFTLQEIEAQSRKPRAQVGGWLLKNAKGILQNRAEKAWQVRKSA